LLEALLDRSGATWDKNDAKLTCMGLFKTIPTAFASECSSTKQTACSKTPRCCDGEATSNKPARDMRGTGSVLEFKAIRFMVPTSKRGECHFGKQLEDTDSVYRKHRARLNSLQEKMTGTIAMWKIKRLRVRQTIARLRVEFAGV
jgi:hypothetical protein